MITEYYWEEGLARIIKREGCEGSGIVRVNYGKRLCRRQQQRKRGAGLGRGPEREQLNCGLRVKRRRVGRSLADRSFQTAPTGLKTRGGEKRQNSVSRVTAPTVPAAQARTIARRARGEREGRRAARRSSQAEGYVPDATNRAARLLAPGSAPSRAPAARPPRPPCRAGSSQLPADGSGEGTCARWPGVASWSPRLGGGVRAARAGRFEKRARDKGSRKPPRRPEPVRAALGAPRGPPANNGGGGGSGSGSGRRRRMRQGAWERRRRGRSGAARARRG